MQLQRGLLLLQLYLYKFRSLEPEEHPGTIEESPVSIEES